MGEGRKVANSNEHFLPELIRVRSNRRVGTRRNAKGNLQLTAYNSRVSSISLKPKNKELQKDINPKRKVDRHKKIANQDRTAALLQISFSPPPNTSFLSLLFTLRTHSVGFLRNPSFTLNFSDQSRNETKRHQFLRRVDEERKE